MVSKRRLDNRDYKRRGPKRDRKFLILVVCEGAVTEREYLKSLQHHFRNPRVRVVVPDNSGVPLTVVKTAIRLKKEAAQKAKAQDDDNLEYNSIWAVFDVDEHPNLAEAKQLAAKEGIDLAISNPCFELWALLHLEDQRAHIERHAVASRLRKHFPEYEKLLPFERLIGGYEQAVNRARSLDEEAASHKEPGRNPTTGVFSLTEQIRTR
ncbi:MAG TPA: RloB family protein [Polyangiaceae bacterium]|nr:RloB family protein [Polyangiaceae bacterium]